MIDWPFLCNILSVLTLALVLNKGESLQLGIQLGQEVRIPLRNNRRGCWTRSEIFPLCFDDVRERLWGCLVSRRRRADKDFHSHRGAIHGLQQQREAMVSA